MGQSYYKWRVEHDVNLFLQLFETSGSDQVGSTGKTPEVAIRRHRLLDGTSLDDYYWDGAIFTATPTWLLMSELDATNTPGLYTYFFEQTLIDVEQVLLIYFRNTATPVGFAIEEHTFSKEGAAVLEAQLADFSGISGSVAEAMAVLQAWRLLIMPSSLSPGVKPALVEGSQQ